MIVLILCAGEQDRWGDNGHPKQLVDIAGEPLLARLVRQCQERGQEPVIITHDERLRVSERSFEPGARRWTCETLLSTRDLWEDRTVVLLGDVVFSEEALDKTFLSRAVLQVFGRKELRYRLAGRYYEIFALSFDHSHAQRMIDVLQQAVADVRTRALEGKSLNSRGKLRGFYDLYCGFPPGKYEHEDTVFCPIEDWTEDIDAPEDYAQFKAMIVQRGWVK